MEQKLPTLQSLLSTRYESTLLTTTPPLTSQWKSWQGTGPKVALSDDIICDRKGSDNLMLSGRIQHFFWCQDPDDKICPYLEFMPLSKNNQVGVNSECHQGSTESPRTFHITIRGKGLFPKGQDRWSVGGIQSCSTRDSKPFLLLRSEKIN